MLLLELSPLAQEAEKKMKHLILIFTLIAGITSLSAESNGEVKWSSLK